MLFCEKFLKKMKFFTKSLLILKCGCVRLNAHGAHFKRRALRGVRYNKVLLLQCRNLIRYYCLWQNI